MAWLGKISRGITCSVEGCAKKATKSVSRIEASSAGLTLPSSGGKVYLCAEHWKIFKKAVRKDRKLERWRWR